MLKILPLAVAAGLMVPVSDTVPRFDVEASCRQSTNSMDGTGERFSGCVRDERAAEARVSRAWGSVKASTRQTCAANEGRAKSYVELLTCVQMFEDAALLK